MLLPSTYSLFHIRSRLSRILKMKVSHIHNNTIKHNFLITIFMRAVEAVQPETLIAKSVRICERHLDVNGKTHPLHKPCYVVGFGKAVFGMAVTLERALKSHLQRGIVSIPEGSLAQLKADETKLANPPNRIEYIEGAKDNIPDKNAFRAAVKIRNLIQDLKTDDLLIVLISGGGSALLPYPKPPVSLEEKQSLIKSLSRRGADIWELNCVRKQISILKGGGLAKLAYPAPVISLVLSDIIGDPLDFIASGPTTPNKDTAGDAIKVIQKYGLYDSIPNSIKDVLEEEQRENQCSGRDIPIKNGNYIHVDNHVIGNNEIAANEAKSYVSSLGIQVAVLSTKIADDVDNLSKIYANLAHRIDSLFGGTTNRDEFKLSLQAMASDLHLAESVIDEISNFDYSKDVCLIGAGEPTVVVAGNGKGGRNQQLALAFSVEVNKLNVKSTDISFLSCGTDGIDGPTDAAGAIGSSDLVENCEMENIKPRDYLLNNDSYTFFSNFNNGRNLVKIGHSGTNVMDIHVLLVSPRL